MEKREKNKLQKLEKELKLPKKDAKKLVRMKRY